MIEPIKSPMEWVLHCVKTNQDAVKLRLIGIPEDYIIYKWCLMLLDSDSIRVNVTNN